VILQNTNPFPRLKAPDTQQYTGTYFPNPNDSERMINFVMPDFEGGKVLNTLGNMGNNDGIAAVVAMTSGKDQSNNDITVWAYTPIVFSTSVLVFKVDIDKNTLKVGEVANIVIEIYDLNGNPVAAGSTLKVGTDGGKIGNTDLIPAADRWGLGITRFATTLVNNLNPEEDDAKTATVEVELKSPNGDRQWSVSVSLTLEKL